jgi:hypothetical protein
MRFEIEARLRSVQDSHRMNKYALKIHVAIFLTGIVHIWFLSFLLYN